jgi:hypothetical protein
MRDQVIDTVGEVANILPLWMTSKQSQGNVLGFTPAWILAYAKPGKGDQLSYYIKTKFGERLNLIDFEVDRYEIDRLLSKNWDPIADSTGGAWVPTPAETYFDLDLAPISQWGNYNYSSGQPVFTPVTWINNTGNAVAWTSSYNGHPTTFDGNSLRFIAPVDMYSQTQIYDKYLVFPYKTILG